jgi:hypothetical protein
MSSRTPNSAGKINTKIEIGDLDGQPSAQGLIACHAHSDRADPIQPIGWSFQPVIARTAEDIGEQQRIASAMSSATFFDLDVLGRLPVALQGQPLAPGAG